MYQISTGYFQPQPSHTLSISRTVILGLLKVIGIMNSLLGYGLSLKESLVGIKERLSLIVFSTVSSLSIQLISSHPGLAAASNRKLLTLYYTNSTSSSRSSLSQNKLLSQPTRS